MNLLCILDMKICSFNLSILILSSLFLRSESLADDFSAKVENLKKSQMALDQMIGPYRALSGFKDTQTKMGRDEEEKAPILRIHNTSSRLQASTGKLLFGKTFNRLVVGSEKSPVIIELKGDQQSFSQLRAIGTATQGSTPGRITIEIQKIIFKGGAAKPVNGIALDKDGALGVEAQVISQKALTISGAMASSFISGIAASEQTTTSNPFGFESTQRSPRNALLGGLAQTAADQSKRLIEDATSEKPVLIVESNTEVTIMLQEEMRF